MGERSIVAVADALNDGLSPSEITYIEGTCYKTKDITDGRQYLQLPEFAEISANKKAYARSGYCYRTGGDEFCVLMENADREAQCAQEFVRQLEQRRKAVDFLPTVSFGSAPFLGEDVLAVKNRADREMYRYKKARKPDAAGEMV